MPKNSNFGYTFSILFFLIFIFIYFYFQKLSIIIFTFSVIFLVASKFFEKVLYYPNYLWFKFGIFLSKFFSPIILLILFIFIFIPLGFVLNITNFKKKPINSNWKKSTFQNLSDNQF